MDVLDSFFEENFDIIIIIDCSFFMYDCSFSSIDCSFLMYVCFFSSIDCPFSSNDCSF